MEIMYYEDIEVGQKRVKDLTYQVKKEEIIKFARHWDPRSYLFNSFVVWHAWE
jgi:hypothetical protein